VTRGDGSVGEDVTENARTIRSLPLRVETRLAAFEVRGETVMNRRAFERLNAERDERGLSRFANPRKRPPPGRCACWSPRSPPRAAWITTPTSCWRMGNRHSRAIGRRSTNCLAWDSR